jgi:hypothetical protein
MARAGCLLASLLIGLRRLVAVDGQFFFPPLADSPCCPVKSAGFYVFQIEIKGCFRGPSVELSMSRWTGKSKC